LREKVVGLDKTLQGFATGLDQLTHWYLGLGRFNARVDHVPDHSVFDGLSAACHRLVTVIVGTFMQSTQNRCPGSSRKERANGDISHGLKGRQPLFKDLSGLFGNRFSKTGVFWLATFLLFAGNHESCHENIHLGWVTYLCAFAGISDRRTPSPRGFPQVRISILAKFACSFAHLATAASASCNQDGEVLLSSSQPCLSASESNCCHGLTEGT
jgi:hypothetical protein